MTSMVTDSCASNHHDSKLPPSLSILGVPIPDDHTTLAYIPQTQECVDTELMAKDDKFGGSFIYETSETKVWPRCHQCTNPLSFMFQCSDPLQAPKTKHIQFLMCTHWSCIADGCRKCKSVGPCYRLIPFDPATKDQKVINISDHTTDFPCFKIINWKVSREPLYFDKLEKHFDTIPNLSALVKQGGNYSDDDWESYIKNLMDVDKSNKYFRSARPISRDQAIIKATQNTLEDEIDELISGGFKFGGTPASRGCREDYDDYLQIYTESYFPYTWNDGGILHVDRQGKMNGDMC
jgi:hypothetical protein